MQEVVKAGHSAASLSHPIAYKLSSKYSIPDIDWFPRGGEGISMKDIQINAVGSNQGVI
jgi:hypothetical protein